MRYEYKVSPSAKILFYGGSTIFQKEINCLLFDSKRYRIESK